MKRALLFAASLLAACASTAAPPPVPAPSATPAPAPIAAAVPNATTTPTREQRLIARTLKKVSALRGIVATRDVPGKTLPRDQLIARVKSHVAREIPPEAIEREGTTLRLLGLVPDDFDYGREMFALLESQLAGFYEPEDATMYMAGDLDGMNAEATLAHELVHALQDQKWDLKRRSKYAPGQSDRQSALAAMAEGDATSAMADYIVSRMDPNKTALDLPDEMFTDQVLGSMSMGEAARAPHVMRTSLVAPYIDGLLFINALRREGGWELVNRAWDDLPQTTEQILHLDKWSAKEPALDVSAPTIAALGPGFKSVDEDTYGEQGMRLLFEEWMMLPEAKTAASGWGGDRGTIANAPGKTALTVHVRYDEAAGAAKDALAERAFKSVGDGLAKLGKARKEAGFVCIERPALGPLAVRREGRELVIVAGPAHVDGKKSSSAGDCALAKSWSHEVAGNR